jgi:hypothetical protein
VNRVIVPIRPYKAEILDEIDKAARFGKLTYLSNQLPISKPQEVAWYLNQKLQQLRYTPETDAILLVGNVVISSIFFALVTKINPSVRMVLYDARDAVRDYQLITFSLEQELIGHGDSNT